jgi:hypothetical protein
MWAGCAYSALSATNVFLKKGSAILGDFPSRELVGPALTYADNHVGVGRFGLFSIIDGWSGWLVYVGMK